MPPVTLQDYCVKPGAMLCPYCSYRAFTPMPDVPTVEEGTQGHGRLSLYLRDHIVTVHATNR